MSQGVSEEQLAVLANHCDDLVRGVREGRIPVEAALSGLQGLIEGRCHADGENHRMVDGEAVPWCPPRWKIVPHKTYAEINFHKITGLINHKSDRWVEIKPSTFELYRSPNLCGNGWIDGNKLRAELSDKRVMSACVLDFLLAHTCLIPESWKERDEEFRSGIVIQFWGTVYEDDRGAQGVRCLYWSNGEWRWCFDIFDIRHPGSHMAALFKDDR